MEVVASDDPMIDAELLRAELGDGVSVRTAPTDTPEAVIDAAADAEALVVDVSTPVTERVRTAARTCVRSPGRASASTTSTCPRPTTGGSS